MNYVNDVYFLQRVLRTLSRLDYGRVVQVENREKQRKNEGFINFSSLNVHFRSADAANHLNARRRVDNRVTRRAYIPKIYKLEE